MGTENIGTPNILKSSRSAGLFLRDNIFTTVGEIGGGGGGNVSHSDF